MAIDTELAWEMTRKALQQHKLNRTPIKLQVSITVYSRDERRRRNGERGAGRERDGWSYTIMHIFVHAVLCC